MGNKDTRREIIKMLYRELLDREADGYGLNDYYNSNLSLEGIYRFIEGSDEHKKIVDLREKQLRSKTIDTPLPITLAMFVKDAEESIAMAINSVKPIVREIVVLDTGSIDNTIEICEKLGALVYKCGMVGFGDIRTLAARLAREEWILGLDSDEIILEEDLYKFRKLINNKEVDIWGLPRKRWADLGRMHQQELEVYPDWQYRFFRNKPEIKYVRRVHEIIEGSDKRAEAVDGPCIQHFQDVFKSGDKLVKRNIHYKNLYDLDIEEGVEHTGKAVEDLDER